MGSRPGRWPPRQRHAETRRGRTARARTKNSRPRTLPSPAHIRSTVAAIVDQPDDLRELRVFHKALADVNRLRIVRKLAEGPATVGELIDTVGLSQPLVSWHVSRLKAAGVVETRRTGREVFCSSAPTSSTKWPNDSASCSACPPSPPSGSRRTEPWATSRSSRRRHGPAFVARSRPSPWAPAGSASRPTP